MKASFFHIIALFIIYALGMKLPAGQCRICASAVFFWTIYGLHSIVLPQDIQDFVGTIVGSISDRFY